MIYVHVPFCRSFCTYCDFYSEVAARCRRADEAVRQESLFGEFAEALAAEAVSRAGEIADDVNTLYIGGGTPSVLPLSAFRRLVEALASVGHGGPFREFTVEVNPEDVVEKGQAYIEGLLELGVNRISMGVQSFDDSVLRFMNRRHDAATAVQAYSILEKAGVRNISIDLIFGLPQLSMSQWKETLYRALCISSRGVLPQHVSSYQLSVEPGSMLARLVEKGAWTEASDEVCQEQYSILCETLALAGYHHYEISNFALSGCEAVHNSAYWRHVPYVGLGPGGHSFASSHPTSAPDSHPRHCQKRISSLPEAHLDASATSLREAHLDASATSLREAQRRGNLPTRQWNRPDLQAYLSAARAGDFSSVREGETLTPDQLVLEHLMLGLRTSEGLPESFLRANCPEKALENALSTGQLAKSADGFLRIPESSFFISDAIISTLV